MASTKNDPGITFLHDLATPLTIIRTLLVRQVHEMEGTTSPSSSEKQIQRMKKVLEAVQKVESLHADYKVLLSSD